MMNNRMKCFLIVFLGMLAAMAPLSTDMYLPALPVLQADFGVSASVAQLTLTMTMLGMAAGQLVSLALSLRALLRGAADAKPTPPESTAG